MAIIARGESQDCNLVARGWEARSRFVCCLYAFKAAVKIVSKFVEEEEVDGTWDMVVRYRGYHESRKGVGTKGTD